MRSTVSTSLRQLELRFLRPNYGTRSRHAGLGKTSSPLRAILFPNRVRPVNGLGNGLLHVYLGTRRSACGERQGRYAPRMARATGD